MGNDLQQGAIEVPWNAHGRLVIVLGVLRQSLTAPEPGRCDRLYCQSDSRCFPE
jgi:hypothetical protein